ncbi:D-beta-D-heptose 1-phosphate adenosyltransferase [Williamsia sp. Leaf354]|uniref:DeoR/GlpR family DNA-binding transcription regulator n=1 Tax=Williamsia sp. Leaf354 TaxID=1736349 RepID=UPI0006F744EA|nr:DeoR/GlpR family DNA-binding transcription regulator [Williamsia sp. Leaf354]KQR98772.1 D-beta-D-heptose 1-phosphate adenosyltransferase [Williamsia sp. Leaf354]
MYAEERQQAIADQVLAHGRASVTALAEEFDVTSETVRRDLASLERAGFLRRVHGGAVPVDAVRVTELGVAERADAHPDEKERIGTAACRFVPSDGGSLVIDAGTTTVQAAARLPRDRALTVFTNSLPVAASVADHPGAQLHFLGGRIRGLTQAAVGPAPITALASFRVDVAFIGTNGITERHGLSTPDPDEGAVKSAMIAAANRVVVLADSSKLGAEDMTRFAGLEEVDVLITDDGIDPGFSAQLSARGVEVVIA